MADAFQPRTVAVAACGVSGGIHLALAAVHAGELPLHSAAFLTAALLLGLTGLVLARRADVRPGAAASATLFAALLAAYPLATHEPFDAIAGISKGAEAIGLLASVRLLRPATATPAPGVLVVFLLFAALGIMIGGGHAHG